MDTIIYLYLLFAEFSMTAIRSKDLLPLQALAGLFLIFITIALIACSNSEPMGFDTSEAISVYSDGTESVNSSMTSDTGSTATEMISSRDTIKNYLPLNDTDYPYAGIPRIVIETEYHREINDRETEIPAKLQIWGKNVPESEIMELTIKGRGNSSWKDMPKKSYKIEFLSKTGLFGMPPNKDWALISNYADKSLIKNTISYQLSNLLEMDYTPKNRFIELYLNSDYLGVYLLVETVKISKTRINVSPNTYLVEFDKHIDKGDQTIKTKGGTFFTIHAPKNATPSELSTLKNHLDSLEDILSSEHISDSTIAHFFDIDSYIKHYWVQEFSKNKDGAFLFSVYFTWAPGGKIKMGPVWDFDGAYGVNPILDAKPPSGWLIRNYYWNKALFRNMHFNRQIQDYWLSNNTYFHSTIELVDTYADSIANAAQNNFKRWPILEEASNKLHLYPYATYTEAKDTLKQWIKARIKWIDINL